MKKLMSKYFLILAISLTAFSQSVVYAGNYFVSAMGNDTNTGTSIQEPLKSINAALTHAAAGDTVFILPGYYKEVIRITGKGGDTDKPICIMGYSKDVNCYPVIDGGCVIPASEVAFPWMIMKNASWIEVSRLTFQNGWTDPIKLRDSHYITFKHCNFYGGKRVIVANGIETHHILIENCHWNQGGNYLWTVRADTLGTPAWLSMHHMAMSYFNGSIIDFRKTGGYVIIRNNLLEDVFNAIRWRGERGYDSNVEIYDNRIDYARDNDFEPETYTYNLYIYHNFSHNIHKTLSIDNVFGGYIYYYGNVVTTDDDPWTKEICTGFWKLYGSERYSELPVYLFNNSLYGPGIAFTQMEGTARHVKHFNNAYYFSAENGWELGEWDADDEFDNDVSNKPWPPNIINHNQEQHGKIGDIKFVDPNYRDLRLQKDSPGIDAGKVVELKELNWKQSYVGKAPDVGAYEDGKLVDGPAFRFRLPEDSKATYKEKPRIVKDEINGSKLMLWFSIPLKPESVSDGAITVKINGKPVSVKSVSFSDENYMLEVETGTQLTEKGISVSFSSLPEGTNGEKFSAWGSTIKIDRN